MRTIFNGRRVAGIMRGAMAGLLASAGYAQPPGADGPKPVVFRTDKVTRGDLIPKIAAQEGVVTPEEVVEVCPAISGRILSVGDPKGKAIDVGAQVEKGEVLAKFDDTALAVQYDKERAGLQLAEANLALSQAKLEQALADSKRMQELAKNNAATQTDLDAAKQNELVAKASVAVSSAELAQHKTQIVQAQMRLEATIIRSPMTGVILDRKADVGQVVAGGETPTMLFQIGSDLKKIDIVAFVGEADVGSVRAEQPAQFVVAAYPDKVFEGRVRKVGLVAVRKADQVMYRVTIAVDNADNKLLPNMSAAVTILKEERKGVLLAPNGALRWRPLAEWIVPDARGAGEPDGGKKRVEVRRVWVREGAMVRPIEVKVGSTDGLQTEITGGDLKEGQEVVTGVAALPGTKDTGSELEGAAQRAFLNLVQSDPALRESLERDARKVQRALDCMGTNLLTIIPGTSPVGGVRDGAGASLTMSDAEQIARQCAAAQEVVPVMRLRAELRYTEKVWTPQLIYGTTPEFLTVRDWTELAEGEPFTDRDVQEGRNVCVVGEKIKVEVFGNESPVGQTMKVRGTSFKVVGVLSRNGISVFGLDQDDLVLAPWTTVRRRLVGEGAPAANPTTVAEEAGVAKLDQIMVKAVSEKSIAEATSQIKNLLRERHHLKANEGDDFQIRDQAEINRAVNSSLNLLKKSPGGK